MEKWRIILLKSLKSCITISAMLHHPILPVWLITAPDMQEILKLDSFQKCVPETANPTANPTALHKETILLCHLTKMVTEDPLL